MRLWTRTISFDPNKRAEFWREAGTARTEADCAWPHTESGNRFQCSELPCFISLWTDWAPVRFGNIIQHISAPERDRLQKNETNRIVWPRLLLSESIVKPSCIGWGSCVERRGVSEIARRLWLPACLLATLLRVATWRSASAINRWSASSQDASVLSKTVTNWW
jgi:hypothetical protein